MVSVEITLDYYLNTFNCGTGGLIPADFLDLYIAKASRRLEALLTCDDTSAHTEKIQYPICEIAEELYRTEKTRGVKSENIDGYSVTYDEAYSVDKGIVEIAVRNLGNTGLLYLGVEK